MIAVPSLPLFVCLHNLKYRATVRIWCLGCSTSKMVEYFQETIWLLLIQLSIGWLVGHSCQFYAYPWCCSGLTVQSVPNFELGPSSTLIHSQKLNINAIRRAGFCKRVTNSLLLNHNLCIRLQKKFINEELKNCPVVSCPIVSQNTLITAAHIL